MLLAGIPERSIKEIGGWKTTEVFHNAIVDRRMMTDAIRKAERYQDEHRAFRVRTSIVKPSEAENTPTRSFSEAANPIPASELVVPGTGVEPVQPLRVCGF